jgi:hypothetical protein
MIAEQVLPENTVNNIAETITKFSNNPRPEKDNNYRYYHCSLDWDGLHCRRVDGPNILPTQENTKMLFVKSYIPERFDSIALKYKWMPRSVSIENKST